MTIAFKPAAYSRELASARLRAYLPCDYLKAAGWACEIFNDSRADEYRTVIFQKSYSHADIALAIRLRQRGVATVFDLCDNHFYDPENRPEFRERADRLERMLDVVDGVTVSTPQIGELVGRPAFVIDDALDPLQHDRLAIARRAWKHIRRGPIRIVWFGSTGLEYPASGLVDLARIMPDLAAAHSRHPIRLTVICDSKKRVDQMAADARLPVRFREYKAATSQAAIRDHDLCIIPVSANPFTICKTLNRPALALQLGVPVIADVIPSYEVLRPFVAVGDWARNLDAFCTHRVEWKTRTEAGADYLRATYTSQRVVQQWAGALARMASRPMAPQAA